MLLAFALACAAEVEAEVEPRVSGARGGEWVAIHGEDFAGHGGVVVTFADVPAHAVVIESERWIRASTPAIPSELHGQPLVVTLHFADGTRRELATRHVFEAGPIEVQPRE